MYTIYRFVTGRSVTVAELSEMANLFAKGVLRRCGQGDHSTLRWKGDWHKIPQYCSDIESGNRVLINEGNVLLFLATYNRSARNVLALRKESGGNWIYDEVPADGIVNKRHLVVLAPKSFPQPC